MEAELPLTLYPLRLREPLERNAVHIDILEHQNIGNCPDLGIDLEFRSSGYWEVSWPAHTAWIRAQSDGI